MKKPTTGQTVLIRSFPTELYRELKIQAAKEGVFVKDLIIKLLAHGLTTQKLKTGN
jgi:plasmid stability protein